VVSGLLAQHRAHAFTACVIHITYSQCADFFLRIAMQKPGIATSKNSRRESPETLEKHTLLCGLAPARPARILPPICCHRTVMFPW
jgi:hypothetical protein